MSDVEDIMWKIPGTKDGLRLTSLKYILIIAVVSVVRSVYAKDCTAYDIELRIDDFGGQVLNFTNKSYLASCRSAVEHILCVEIIIDGYPSPEYILKGNLYYFSTIVNGNSSLNGITMQCRGRLENVEELCTSNSITFEERKPPASMSNSSFSVGNISLPENDTLVHRISDPELANISSISSTTSNSEMKMKEKSDIQPSYIVIPVLVGFILAVVVIALAAIIYFEARYKHKRKANISKKIESSEISTTESDQVTGKSLSDCLRDKHFAAENQSSKDLQDNLESKPTENFWQEQVPSAPMSNQIA